MIEVQPVMGAGQIWINRDGPIEFVDRGSNIPTILLDETAHGVGVNSGTDALHLAQAQGYEAFVSFDQRFAIIANALSKVKVRAP